LVIKIIAANKNEDLWKYCDPSAVTPPQIALLPLPATAQDIRSNTLDIAGLTEEEYNKFQRFEKQNDKKTTSIKTIRKTLLDIRNHIIKTVAKKYYYLFETKTEVHNILVALKARLAPTDEARKAQAARE
jgi:Glu-tRNA(Gln) amidotransferase subunit E-like FAD-binding protein